MLSVSTLWTVLIINFLALGLIWAYVLRTYPSFEAAKFWTGSAVACAAATALGMLRPVFPETMLPLLAGGTMLVFATCLAAMGIRRFYDQPVDWGNTALMTLGCSACLIFFIVVHDSAPVRITIFTIAQALPLVLSAKLLLSPPDGRRNAGARLAGIIASLILGIYGFRLLAGLAHLGGEFTFSHFNQLQTVLVLVLVFLSMALNFGFLLMAMDRLRNEVADLALMDDLTGVANRRHLLQRLTEECARSERSAEAFSLLVIDLDGFKSINDTHGHAAGDACLQHFTLMAQTRLRPGDMLARTGGDEFCVVLPSSTLREGAMIARRVLDVCRADAEQCMGSDIPDLCVDRRGAMDPCHRRLPGPADRRGRRGALYRQAGRPQPLCDPRVCAPVRAAARARTARGRADRGRAAGRHPQARLNRAKRYRIVALMKFRLLMLALLAGALAPPAAAQSPDLAALARAAGTPEIPGLKIVWLSPWGDVASAHPWKNIIVHQTEGPAGSARGGAQLQNKSPTRRGVMVWVETDGTVYWAVAENLIPTHGDGANRNDNKYIDNGPTFRQVVGNVSVGVEFAGNFPDVTRGPTEAQIAAWKILVKVLRLRYGIPLDRVYAHNWIDYKDARYCEGCALAKMAREWGE